MSKVVWTEVQKRRLVELDAADDLLGGRFESAEQRDRLFQSLEKQLAVRQRRRLRELREVHRRPMLCRLESRAVEALTASGFVQVATPIIMSKGLLARMSIDDAHPLSSQVFWLDEQQCLRPMLAPHLYFVLKDLLRLWEKPVRIFEIGPCFRKESRGARHSSEFTMLNLVEMGLPVEDRDRRLEEMASVVLQAAGIEDYRVQAVDSAVYGRTVDILSADGSIELGSAAVGPHPLDEPWRIMEPWVGIGFGLERLLMVAGKSSNLARVGRSLGYLDGVRLNI
jgi:phenylalanyl-tRNA synthetase alpha chain